MSIVLIPCKSLDGGKSRLAPVLDREGRRAFCEMLLVQALTVAKSVAVPAEIRLVSGDPAVCEIGRLHGVQTIGDEGDGLNDALDGARKRLLDEFGSGAAALVLPIDLPFASGPALRQVMQSGASVAIVPDRKGEGTNLLWLEQGVLPVFRFSYGAKSFAAHCDAARSAGLTWRVVHDAALGFDVDTPEDYIQWKASSLRVCSS